MFELKTLYNGDGFTKLFLTQNSGTKSNETKLLSFVLGIEKRADLESLPSSDSYRCKRDTCFPS